MAPARPIMPRVLISSRSPAILQAVSRLAWVDGLGWEWECVADQTAAVTAIRDRPFDAVLVDVAGDGTDGLQAIETIAGVASRTRIIAVADEADHGLLRSAHNLGARGFLSPLCSASELLSAIRSGISDAAAAGGAAADADRTSAGGMIDWSRWRSRAVGEVKWGWSDMALFVPLWLAGSLGAGDLLYGAVTHLPTLAHPPQALSSLLGQVSDDGVAVLVVLLLVLWRRRSALGDLGWNRFQLRWLAISLPVAAATVVVTSVLTSLSGLIFTSPTSAQCSDIHQNYSAGAVFALLAVSVAAPLGEETVFRGFLYGWLRHRLPRWLAVVTSAAVFSASHAIPAIALPLFAVGVVLAIVYEESGAIWPGAVVHGVFNLVGLIGIFSSSC